VVIVPCARTLYIAGQVPLDKNGELVGAGDFEAQVRQTFENLKSALVAKAEAAKLPDAGISPKQCPGRCAAEKGWPTELGRSVRYRRSYVSR
jgi:Endoribonuclease L-PSP